MEEITSDLNNQLISQEEGSLEGDYENIRAYSKIEINKLSGIDVSDYNYGFVSIKFDVYLEDAQALIDFNTEFGNEINVKEF